MGDISEYRNYRRRVLCRVCQGQHKVIIDGLKRNIEDFVSMIQEGCIEKSVRQIFTNRRDEQEILNKKEVLVETDKGG